MQSMVYLALLSAYTAGSIVGVGRVVVTTGIVTDAPTPRISAHLHTEARIDVCPALVL